MGYISTDGSTRFLPPLFLHMSRSRCFKRVFMLRVRGFVCVRRLQERRRSSVVVSLPGLDVSPGDLFVSNGAADILNGSNFSGTVLRTH